jgi:2-(1,2-epoxy-1,2-dihydrophenyl)acetyl-CoA isomerase
MSADTSAGGSHEELVLEVAEGVATLTLNRPEALNALTIRLKSDLISAVRELGRDRGVRAVVLTGAGRAFCAGQDLRERQEPDAPPLGVELRERYNPLIRALRDLPKPVLAAVNGVAAGAGLSLALACDVRIAGESASFLVAFGRIGLVPDSGATWLLPRLVGAAKAAELALLDEPLSAAEAQRIGLVARVVPGERLPEEAAQIARRLADLAPRGVAYTKRALEQAWDADLDEQLEREAWLQGLAGATEDHREGIAAFLEKRPPRFTGD